MRAAAPLRVPRTRTFKRNMYYNVAVAGLALGDTALEFESQEWEAGYGTVLDSGTTFSFVPKRTAAHLRTELYTLAESQGFPVVPVPGYDLCFQSCASPCRFDLCHCVAACGNTCRA